MYIFAVHDSSCRTVSMTMTGHVGTQIKGPDRFAVVLTAISAAATEMHTQHSYEWILKFT